MSALGRRLSPGSRVEMQERPRAPRRPPWRHQARRGRHQGQTRLGDFPSVTVLCVGHGRETRPRSHSRSVRAVARPVGVAGRPFPPKPPGISFPSGCCCSAFSPRSPEGPGAGGWKEHGRGPRRAGHQAQVQLDWKLGRGRLVTWPPERGRSVHQRPWSHSKAHRLPAVRLGVAHCPPPPGILRALSQLCRPVPRPPRCTAVEASSCVSPSSC